MRKARRVGTVVLVVLALGMAVAGTVVYRGLRVWRVVWDFESQIRYLVENDETIGTAPAGEALAVDYLEEIFRDNQELLGKLKGVVQRGLEDTPALQLGEVAAMVVTYRRSDEGKVEDVVAHVVGGFPMGKRKPGFHRDGYFRGLIDPNLFTLGNSIISIFGRDMIIFAEEQVAQSQQEILQSVFFQGDIYPLVQNLDRPMYYTAVFPDPRRLVPLQLRHHIQALVLKGSLSPEGGRSEWVILTPSARSASYALSILSDMKRIGEVALKTKWKGVPIHTAWGTYIDAWWAYEMIQASEKATMEKQHNIVRIRTDYGRIMVNAMLKSVERMGRDMAQMHGSLEERLDPRLVDERLASRKPAHYWSTSHRWGPDWPFAGPTTNQTEVIQTSADTSEGAAQPEPAPAATEQL